MFLKNTFAILLVASCVCAVRAADDTVYDIPKLDGITVDGKADDWGDKGFKVDNLKDSSGKSPAATNFSASFRLGWNDDGLLVLITVTDDIPLEPEEKIFDIWKGDSVEMFMATARGAEDHMQVVIAPGRDPNHKELRSNVSDYRKEKKGKLAVTAARTLTDNGYVMEALLPWKNLNITAADGKEVGFQFFANDTDKPGERYQLLWFPKPDAHADTKNMYSLRLTTKAAAAAPAPASSAPVISATPAIGAPAAKSESGGASKALITMEGAPKEPSLKVTEAGYEEGRGTITVTASSKLKGKQIKVKDGDKNVGKGKLEIQGEQAVAHIKLDKPKDNAYGSLTVLYEDEPVATVKLPDAK